MKRFHFYRFAVGLCLLLAATGGCAPTVARISVPATPVTAPSATSVQAAQEAHRGQEQCERAERERLQRESQHVQQLLQEGDERHRWAVQQQQREQARQRTEYQRRLNNIL